MSKHIAILGGGPAGLYAGRVLTQKGYQVTVLDKGERPGGLATSFRFGENWYDLGVHMLHAFDKEIFEDIQQLMGEERIEVDLNAKIKWGGSFFRYPLQFQDMIKGIPFFKLCYQVLGLFYTQMIHTFIPANPSNAEDALIALYGKPLYKFFFEDFTHRYWEVHPRDLSATFITTKMPKLSAVDVLKRYLTKIGIKERVKSTECALISETLHYSRNGAEAMPRCIAQSITHAGSAVLQNSLVTEIITEKNTVKEIVYQHNGEIKLLQCDACISTIPLRKLMSALTPTPPENILHASEQLRYKPIVIYGLLVKKERCLDALYVYYRNRVFHRIGEPKNAGLNVIPSDHTVLIVEMTCEKDDAKWRGEEIIKQKLYQELSAEGICEKDDIREMHLYHSEFGYPIFDLGFETYLEIVKKHIAQFNNLRSTGRQGAFTYPNMHAAMRMGYKAAEEIMKEI